MTILHGDDRFYNNIFVQKWPAESLLIRHDSDDGVDQENREVGTHVMDEYPTYEEWIKKFDMDTDTPDMKKLEPAHFQHLPVWVNGNVYFNGAKAYKKESSNLIDAEHEVKVEVTMQDGKPVLATNLYEFLDGFTVDMVNSDVLGEAFEPEEKYENPDGTPITFDRDYFGDHRGTQILPGPFSGKDADGRRLW